MLVVEFDRTKFEGEIIPELERLKEAGIVRLLDLLFVRKPVGGELEVVQRSDLSEDEAIEFGALVGALVGLGTGDEELSYRAAVAGAEELEDGHFFGDDGGLVPRRRDSRGRQRGDRAHRAPVGDPAPGQARRSRWSDARRRVDPSRRTCSPSARSRRSARRRPRASARMPRLLERATERRKTKAATRGESPPDPVARRAPARVAQLPARAPAHPRDVRLRRRSRATRRGRRACCCCSRP